MSGADKTSDEGRRRTKHASNARNDGDASRPTIAMDHLPQHVLLYAALVCAVAAVAFSIRTHLSTNFVALERPIRVSPYLKGVDRVGLSTWELCAMNQDALEELVADMMDGDGDGDFTAVAQRLSLSASTTTTDSGRDVTSVVQTTYHSTPQSSTQSKGWMQEPDHDDVLVSGDYPYNDDDAFEDTLPTDYWTCHQLHITSTSARYDIKWNLARMFFMMGTIVGIASTILLAALIVRSSRDARRRWRHCQEARSKLHRQQSSQMELLEHGDAQSETQSNAHDLQLLDTDSTGYRPISICFVTAYLLQLLTLLFLDSRICRNQVCSMAAGARGLLAACALWVASGMLVLAMFKQVRRNERLVRLHERRVNRKLKRQERMQALQMAKSNAGEDAKSLLSMTSFDCDDTEDQSEKKEAKQTDEDSLLNTTADTECSECSSSELAEEV